MKELFHRTSVRKYLDKQVEDEKVEMMLKGAMAAPSAGNQQPWEFYVVKNKETIENIREIHKDDNNNIEIYIGEENKIDNDVTVIKTTYKTENDNGTIAIIGPKRMDYERVVSMLEYIKKNIER